MLTVPSDAIYLDHAGTTLHSKSFMEKFMTDMLSNLYGNPHSASPSSQLTTSRIEDIRHRVLHFFKADPDVYDIVFIANATAGIKLVMDAMRELDGGFNYIYHRDSHTSVVGVRESSAESHCLDDEGVENWLQGNGSVKESDGSPLATLFAYPAQSNLNGRRLPLSWIKRSKELATATLSAPYTLLDASALVSTAQLDLSDNDNTPDFTVLSFYKIFGFPDLGALIVQKESGRILQGRKYFGGGTVDVVVSVKEQWHELKGQSLHESLEDGTLPFHSIMALDAAMEVHKTLYKSMDHIAKHTAFLAKRLYDGLALLRHANSEPVCVIHSAGFEPRISSERQGPVMAFNVRNSQGAWVSNVEFERLAAVRNFHIRSGGLCNPGGVATSLELEPWEIRRNFSSGFRCGVESDIYAGKITGILRASLGAVSTIGDVDAFVGFVKEFFAESNSIHRPLELNHSEDPVKLYVESLTIYPIKSCGGFNIPAEAEWDVKPEGLAWDREWCLIHMGTGQALSQKRHSRMALIRPRVDLTTGQLHVSYAAEISSMTEQISIPLSAHPAYCTSVHSQKCLSSRVCGDSIIAQTYNAEVSAFFSRILDVPCTLARFPAGGSGSGTRHSKAHMQKHQRQAKYASQKETMPGAFPCPPTPPDSDSEASRMPILLSNESPILVINRSSLDSLNSAITSSGGKSAAASVFRANVVLGSYGKDAPQPYAEDHWSSLRIGQQYFKMLGSCRRCHMICINQETANKDEEPFVTLARTRRFESKIFFGSHMCHIPQADGTKSSQCPTIKVGDSVTAITVED
jgi:molybdenum cofactor sulfurtransferase